MPRPTKTRSFATLVLAAFTFGAVAQTVDAHHPAKAGDQPVETQPANQAPANQMGAMMAGIMAGMPVMQMMKAMQGQNAMGGIDLTERVEGRIAFLKAELAITVKQADKWNAFADALRAYSAALKSAELDGVRGLKTALAPLMELLSDDQKATAAELLPLHMGLGMASQPMHGMGMMGGGAMKPKAP